MSSIADLVLSAFAVRACLCAFVPQAGRDVKEALRAVFGLALAQGLRRYLQEALLFCRHV